MGFTAASAVGAAWGAEHSAAAAMLSCAESSAVGAGSTYTGGFSVPTRYATVFERSLLNRLSKQSTMVRFSSATQLPETVSLLSYLSTASTSSSRDPPHS